MKIAIISTGNELLKGQIADTNGAWIASRLYEMGLDVQTISVVADDLDQLTASLKNAFAKYDLTIVGGGLGPTVDDITAQAAALATNRPLVRNTSAEEQIIGYFTKLDRPMNPVNLKQALLPKSCQILPNEWGTAPGFILSIDDRKAAFLPGPPTELKPMFEGNIDVLIGENRPTRHTAIFKCYGLGESNMQAAVAPVQKSFPSLGFAFRASFPEISLTVSGKDPDEVQLAKKQIEPLLGNSIFAKELIQLPDALANLLLQTNLSVASAESCTGGLIGHELTRVSGSSSFYKGGIIAYSNQIKTEQLGIPFSLLDTHGAVSEEVVTLMATNVAATFGTHIGVATSGIAGPTGGTPDKPVGTVHIGIAYKNRIIHRQCMFKGYNRSRIRTASAWTAMKMIRDLIVEKI